MEAEPKTRGKLVLNVRRNLHLFSRAVPTGKITGPMMFLIIFHHFIRPITTFLQDFLVTKRVKSFHINVTMVDISNFINPVEDRSGSDVHDNVIGLAAPDWNNFFDFRLSPPDFDPQPLDGINQSFSDEKFFGQRSSVGGEGKNEGKKKYGCPHWRAPPPNDVAARRDQKFLRSRNKKTA